jgi:uncharacterized caspase-like protein
MSEPSHSVVRAKTAYALIIGISQYRDQRIPKLKFTHADAQAFYDLLLDPQRIGFPKENVKLLLDDEATLFNLKHAISGWLYQHATPDSTVIFFFAGHGHQEEDKTATEADGMAKYLLPWDVNPDNLFASALSSSEFNLLLRIIKARRLIFFIDACYSGGVTAGARDVGIVDNPSFDRLVEGEGRLLITAAKPHQRSWEDDSLGHGIFTHHLLEALDGKADMDHDGYVSVLEVFKYLEREVPQSARRLSRSVQEPLLRGEFSNDIMLAMDAERVRVLAAQRAASERQRKEEIQMKRRSLSDLLDRGELPLEVYQEALILIEKSPRDMTTRESKLAKNLEALLKGGISAEVYLDNRGFIHSKPEHIASGRTLPDPLPVNTAAQTPKPSERNVKYCIYCGTQIRLQNTFCTGCGNRIRS